MAAETTSPSIGVRKKKVRFSAATKAAPNSAKSKQAKKPEVPADVCSKIYNRVAREEKAYRIVERMIDNLVSVELLQKSLKYINQATYNDIVDERAIVRNCGYPVCLTKLPANQSQQTYKIDRSVNKVYKLEERNKFCSGACFTYSRQLRDQLSPEPVWLIPSTLHKSITVVPVLSSQVSSGKVERVPQNHKIDDKYIIDNVDFTTVQSKDTKCDNSDALSFRHPVLPAQNIDTILARQFSWLDVDSEDDDAADIRAAQTVISDILTSTVSMSDKVAALLKEWVTKSTHHYMNSLGTTYRSESSAIDSDDDSTNECLLDHDLRLVQSVCHRNPQLPLPDIESLSEQDLTVLDKGDPASCIDIPKVDYIHTQEQRLGIVQSKVQAAAEWIFENKALGYSNLSAILVGLISTFNLTKNNSIVSEKLMRSIVAVLLISLYPHISDILSCVATSHHDFVAMLSSKCDMRDYDFNKLSQLLHSS